MSADGRRRWARRFANAMTAARGAITLMILLEAKRLPAEAVRRVILLSLAGWTTDVLDGKLGRYSRLPGGIWARLDLPLDTAMTWAIGWVFSVWGYIPQDAYLGYALLAAVATLFRPNRTTVMAFSAPVTALPLWMSWRTDPGLGLAYVAWISAVLYLDWRRFWGVVASFIEGLPPRQREYLLRLLHPWLKHAE
ncbi:MAG: hypothetical protein AB1503_06425 [Bacillota bacterium]|nr:hypothetical protein [Bacillota bacterium]